MHQLFCRSTRSCYSGPEYSLFITKKGFLLFLWFIVHAVQSLIQGAKSYSLQTSAANQAIS